MFEMLHTLADNHTRPALWQRVGIALTHCQQRRVFFESNFPTHLQKQFPELTFEVPMFWVNDDTFILSAARGFGFSEDSWKRKLLVWMEQLPQVPFRVPSETSREERSQKLQSQLERQEKELLNMRSELHAKQTQSTEQSRQLQDANVRMANLQALSDGHRQDNSNLQQQIQHLEEANRRMRAKLR